MTAKFVTARNTITGKVALVPAHYLEHPVLGEHLIEAKDGAKDAEPTMYKAKTAEEAKAIKADKAEKAPKADAGDEKPLD